MGEQGEEVAASTRSVVARQRDTVKKSAMLNSTFLQGPKAERVSEQDADAILAEAFVYHDRLIELLLATVRFQMSYHLVIGVKKMLRESFDKIILKADWANLVQQDPNLQKAIEQTDEKLRRIDESIGKLDQLLY